MKSLARPRDKAEILQRLRTVRPDAAPRWGRMSAHQMVCHLSDALLMALDRRPASDASTFLRRTLVKWIALYVPLRWPPGIETRPELDQAGGGTKPLAFAADVAQLESLFHVITDSPPAEWPPHPIFGRMSQGAWMRWAYLHADHHLRQFGA